MSKKDPYKIVFDRYQQLADLYTPSAKTILKTDCYNEAINRPIIKNDLVNRSFLIEYNQEHIDLAIKANPYLHVLSGDIRENLYYFYNAKVSFSNYFNLIMDFSTIDHVPQFYIEDVLENYRSMLKTGGKLVLVSWFNEKDPQNSNGNQKDEWNSVNQYFFDELEFKNDLKSRFSISSEAVIASYKEIPAPEGCYIKEFVCKKKRM